jgi:hypothetical protein
MKRVTLLFALTLTPALINAGPAHAGDVVAYLGGFFNSSLIIVGDNLGNEIRITQDTPSHVRIEGVNGTTVNGLPSVDLSNTAEWIDYASIDLGTGDDVVEYVFTGEFVSTGTDFTTGNGDDQVTVRLIGVRLVASSLWIDTGTGSDTVTVQLAESSIDGSLNVNTGDGDDAVFIEADNSWIEGGVPAVIIETEEGNDLVQFEGYVATFYYYISILLGKGDDILVGDPNYNVFPYVYCRAGSGDDTVLNASYFGRTLYKFETIVE